MRSALGCLKIIVYWAHLEMTFMSTSSCQVIVSHFYHCSHISVAKALGCGKVNDVILYRLVRDSSALKGGSRVLTRIHVHTLAYQAILTTDPVMWPHSDIAAAKASLTAHRHVCATPQVLSPSLYYRGQYTSHT